MVSPYKWLWRISMKPQTAVSFRRHQERSNILPLVLQRTIQAQVLERPKDFIRQVLQGGIGPTYQLLKMDHKTLENTDCKQESNPEKAGIDSHENECSPKETENVHLKAKGKRKRNQVSESADGAQRPKRKSPNYFVSVQITDSKILSTAKRIQEGILQASEVDLTSTCIEPIKFHITLMVMHLGDEEAVKKAEEAMMKLGPILAEKLKGREVALEFKGLSVFGGGRVVFSQPEPSQGLDDLRFIAEEVKCQMKEYEIESSDHDKKVFHPHLTLFKFKDNKNLAKQGIRKIQESLYAPFKEEEFGFQEVTRIQLCQMGETREDGYYKVNSEVNWCHKGNT